MLSHTLFCHLKSYDVKLGIIKLLTNRSIQFHPNYLFNFEPLSLITESFNGPLNGVMSKEHYGNNVDLIYLGD